MLSLVIFLLTQPNGDTLRWYDTTAVGYECIGYTAGGVLHWAIVLPIDSSLDGRVVHSGRVNICEPLDSSGTLRLCLGDYNTPNIVLDSGSFHASDSLSFQEVFFGDTISLHDGDTIWLWCKQWHAVGEYPATTDAGPAMDGYGNMVSFDGIGWMKLSDFGFDYNWVMELILTPSDVEEGPAKPEEKLVLIPAPGGFWITGYSGPTQIYDPAGRLVLGKEIKGKTLISPLRPGVYFVVAGKQRARVAVK